MSAPFQFRPLIDRFTEKYVIDEKTGCWNWTAAKNNAGYGMIHPGGPKKNNVLAHRVSWRLFKGAIPIHESYHGMCVLHKCDNPGCVNPDHLFLGTNKDNVADCISKGRANYVAPQRLTIKQRFDAHYEKVDGGCWVWKGELRAGFPRMSDGKSAQRVSYELAKGIIVKQPTLVRSRCGIRHCVNPEHLVLIRREPVLSEAFRSNMGGEARRVLSVNDVRAVVAMLADGAKSKDVAQKFGVTPGQVYHIKNGRSWSHVTGHQLRGGKIG